MKTNIVFVKTETEEARMAIDEAAKNAGWDSTIQPFTVDCRWRGLDPLNRIIKPANHAPQNAIVALDEARLLIHANRDPKAPEVPFNWEIDTTNLPPGPPPAVNAPRRRPVQRTTQVQPEPGKRSYPPTPDGMKQLADDFKMVPKEKWPEIEEALKFYHSDFRTMESELINANRKLAEYEEKITELSKQPAAELAAAEEALQGVTDVPTKAREMGRNKGSVNYVQKDASPFWVNMRINDIKCQLERKEPVPEHVMKELEFLEGMFPEEKYEPAKQYRQPTKWDVGRTGEVFAGGKWHPFTIGPFIGPDVLILENLVNQSPDAQRIAPDHVRILVDDADREWQFKCKLFDIIDDSRGTLADNNRCFKFPFIDKVSGRHYCLTLDGLFSDTGDAALPVKRPFRWCKAKVKAEKGIDQDFIFDTDTAPATHKYMRADWHQWYHEDELTDIRFIDGETL